MTDKVTVKEAALRLNVTPSYVRAFIQKGKLTAHRTTPRKTMVYVSSIDALIKASNS